MNLLPRQNGGKSESADKMVETWPYCKKKKWLEKKKKKILWTHPDFWSAEKPVNYVLCVTHTDQNCPL